MHPILFRMPDWLGGIEIPTYGVFAVLGIVVGASVFALLAHRLGHAGLEAYEVALETILVGFVSSKVIGIAFQPAAADITFWERVTRSGGTWYVGFLAGVAYAIWRFGTLRIRPLPALDCAAVAVAAGHFLGRIGCFFAGCCWGGRCDLPWAVTFTSERAHQLVGVPLGVALHPVQLYEAAAEALTAALLFTLVWRRAHRFHLQPGLLYLIAYGLVRFSLEFLRSDPRGEAGILSPSQLIAACVLAVAIPLYVLGHVRGTIVPWHPRVPGGDARRDFARG